MVTPVVDPGLSLTGVDPNKQLGFGNRQGSSCEFWVRMQDFNVNFRIRARIFIMVLEADRGLTGSTTPTWMYLGLPLVIYIKLPTSHLLGLFMDRASPSPALAQSALG